MNPYDELLLFNFGIDFTSRIVNRLVLLARLCRVSSNRELAGKLNDPEKNREIAGNFAKNKETPGIFIQLFF